MSKAVKTKNLQRGQFITRVVEQRKFGRGHWSISLELEGAGADVFGQARAGQFVQIACREVEDRGVSGPLLRRPFSIAGVSSKADNSKDGVLVEIIYQVLGPGTQWLQRRSAGDRLDILGPLGNGFKLGEDSSRSVILIGGGVGLPPMFFLADQLAQSGFNQVVALAGAKGKGHFEGSLDNSKFPLEDPLQPQMVIEQFKRSGTAGIIATEDGSLGHRGDVVTALEIFLDRQRNWQGGMIYTCGPEGMLRAVAKLAARRGMDCQVCMEAYMACGIGVCQSCVVPVINNQGNGPKYQLVCSHGPVFDARTIIWE